MAHRLTSHHRALFSPKYLSGTSAHITTTSYFRTPFEVKDKDDFRKKVLASAKPVLVDFYAEYGIYYLFLSFVYFFILFYGCFFSGLQETNISHLSPMELFSDCIAETSLWILNNYTATGWIKFLEPYKLQKIMRKISIKFDPIRQKWPIYHIHLPLLIIYEKSYLLLIGRKQVHFHVI